MARARACGKRRKLARAPMFCQVGSRRNQTEAWISGKLRCGSGLRDQGIYGRKDRADSRYRNTARIDFRYSHCAGRRAAGNDVRDEGLPASCASSLKGGAHRLKACATDEINRILLVMITDHAAWSASFAC